MTTYKRRLDPDRLQLRSQRRIEISTNAAVVAATGCHDAATQQRGRDPGERDEDPHGNRQDSDVESPRDEGPADRTATHHDRHDDLCDDAAAHAARPGLHRFGEVRRHGLLRVPLALPSLELEIHFLHRHPSEPRPQHLACARQARTHVGFGDAEHVGNLAVAESFEHQRHDLAMVHRQTLYRVEQAAPFLFGGERFLGIGPAVFDLELVVGILDRQLPARDVGDRPIVRDAEDERALGALAAKAGKRAPDRDDDVLQRGRRDRQLSRRSCRRAASVRCHEPRAAPSGAVRVPAPRANSTRRCPRRSRYPAAISFRFMTRPAVNSSAAVAASVRTASAPACSSDTAWPRSTSPISAC